MHDICIMNDVIPLIDAICMLISGHPCIYTAIFYINTTYILVYNVLYSLSMSSLEFYYYLIHVLILSLSQSHQMQPLQHPQQQVKWLSQPQLLVQLLHHQHQPLYLQMTPLRWWMSWWITWRTIYPLMLKMLRLGKWPHIQYLVSSLYCNICNNIVIYSTTATLMILCTVCMCVCMYVCTYACMNVCMYVCIMNGIAVYTHTRTHTHTHTLTHTHMYTYIPPPCSASCKAD